MSATLNAALFAGYFGGCPVVEIPGRAHPVTALFLEDALQHTGCACAPQCGHMIILLLRSARLRDYRVIAQCCCMIILLLRSAVV